MIKALRTKTQRWLGFDVTYVTKGFSWLFLSNTLSALIVLALSYLFANFLDPSVYGTYKYILSVGTILTIFSLNGLPIFIRKDAAKHEQNFLGSGFRLLYRWGLLMTLAAVVIAAYYWWSENLILAAGIALFGIAKPLILSLRIYKAQLGGFQRFRLLSIFSFAQTSVYGVLMAVAVFLTNNPVVLISTFLVAELLTTTLCYLYTKHEFTSIPRAEVPRQTWRAGLQVSISHAPQKILSNLDAIIAFQFLGASQLALYSFTVLIPKEIDNVKKIIGGLYLPKIAKRNLHAVRGTIHFKAFLMFIASVSIYGLYALSAPLLFEWLFPRYTDGIYLTQLAGLIILSMPATLYNQALVVFENTIALHVIDIGTPLIRLALLATLFPFLGLMGIVLALVGSRILRLLISFTLFQFFTKPPVNATPA